MIGNMAFSEPHTVAGFAADALGTLTQEQVLFIQRLPKAELHAHLNGSIPIPLLCELAREHLASDDRNADSDAETQAGLEMLQNCTINLETINDFFGLFPAIYAITSTRSSLARAARGVLHEFLDSDGDGAAPQCTYMELRTTPRETLEMSRWEYVCVVLAEVEQYPDSRAAMIVSLDRRMEEEELRECVGIVKRLKEERRRVVGVNLCGDPMVCISVLVC
jgi:adenosine deaminase